MFANFHTHTPRCGHAVGSEEEYIKAAIAAGHKIIGFSDHTPYRFPNGFISYFRMPPEKLENYVTTVRALKEKYRGQIEVKIGLEAEYYPAIFDDLLEMIRPYDLDYLILGQHLLGNEENDFYSGTPTDDPTLLRRYVDQVLCGLHTGKFTYLAHPDLIHFTGDDETYRGEMSRLCEFSLRHDIPTEINLLGLWDHRHYPSERFIRLCGEYKNPVIFGIDAHQPERYFDRDVVERAEGLVKKYGVRLIDVPALRRPNEAPPIA